MKPQVTAIFNLYGNNVVPVGLNLTGKNKSQVVAEFVAKIQYSFNQNNIVLPNQIIGAIKAIAAKIENLSTLAAAGVAGFIYGDAELTQDCKTIGSLLTHSVDGKFAFAVTVFDHNMVEQLNVVRNLISNQSVIFVESDKAVDNFLVLSGEEIVELWGKCEQPNKKKLLEEKAKINIPHAADFVQQAIDFLKPKQLPQGDDGWLEPEQIQKEKVDANMEIINVFQKALKKVQEEKEQEKGKVNPDIVHKIKVAIGAEEPDPVPVEENLEPPKPKNPAVVAALEKALAIKQAKEDQRQKDMAVQNPNRQKLIKAQVAEIMRQKKEKELEKQRLIAEEAKKSLEEQKAKIGNLFAVPKEGEFNGFKFNAVIKDDDNDAETLAALENLKAIDKAKPKVPPKKELTEVEKKIEEAKALAAELKLQQLQKQQEEAKKEFAKKAEANKKKKADLNKAANDAMQLLANLQGGEEKKEQNGIKVKVVKVPADF